MPRVLGCAAFRKLWEVKKRSYKRIMKMSEKAETCSVFQDDVFSVLY